MEQVGIVTWFGTQNYGSNLQAIGLASSINALGYDALFVKSFRVKSFMIRHPFLLYARVVNRLNKNKRKAFFSPIPYQINDNRKKRLDAFRNDTFRSVSFDNKSWEEAVQNRMIFIAGSDILWNPARGYPAMNFLDFAYYARLPRFSFGSSVGASELPEKYYPAYRKYLSSMVEVGVREQAVVDMLQPIIHRKVMKVIDPSLLLTTDDWDQYAEKAELSVSVRKEGYILCYFVMNDPRYWEYVIKIREATKKQIIVLPMHHLDEEQPYDVVLDGTVYEFLWLIKNADFICTDSFHACAMSLLYQKDFYLLRRTRKAEDAKYDDFLNRYHLRDRVVQNESQFIQKPQTDYSPAQKQLEKDRGYALSFIEKAMNECRLLQAQ